MFCGCELPALGRDLVLIFLCIVAERSHHAPPGCEITTWVHSHTLVSYFEHKHILINYWHMKLRHALKTLVAIWFRYISAPWGCFSLRLLLWSAATLEKHTNQHTSNCNVSRTRSRRCSIERPAALAIEEKRNVPPSLIITMAPIDPELRTLSKISSINLNFY